MTHSEDESDDDNDFGTNVLEIDTHGHVGTVDISARASEGGVAARSGIEDIELSEEDRQMHLNMLLQTFNEEQMSRYELFRRANLNRGSIRRLAQGILHGQSVSGNMAIVIAGFGKVFVGEIVEKAVQVRNERLKNQAAAKDVENVTIPDNLPLTPADLREAYRQYKQERNIPSTTAPRVNTLFR